MICSNCKKDLSIQDVKQNKWEQDIEIFVIICPFCNFENTIKISLFENEHLNQYYINLLSQDSSYSKKTNEKFLDYVQIDKKEKILNHLSKCAVCFDKLEEMRLFEVYNKSLQNEQLYKFFLKKAENIIIELKKKDFKIKNKRIEHFFYKNQKFYPNEMFYEIQEHENGLNLCKTYYKITTKNFTIGIVSFVLTNNKIILEKIWFKNKQIIKKEQKFVKDIKKGKTRILFDTIIKFYKNNFL